MKYRLVAALAIVLFLNVLNMGMIAYATGKTCADFTYQEDAQAYYDGGGGRATADYFGMDQDGDGIACESLLPRPSSDNTGLGSSWIIGGIAVVGLAGIATFISRSRNKQSTQRPGTSSLPVNNASITPTPPAQPTPIVVNIPVNIDTRTEQTVQSTTTATASQSGSPDDWHLTPEKARAMPYKDYLRTPYWRKVRDNNISRAGGKCRDCGRANQMLQVHHLSYEFLGQEKDQYLVVLCESCHERRHDIAPPPKPQMNA